MEHLTSEQILAYLDGNEELVNLKKASAHLDRCIECAKKLREEASYNLTLNFAGMQKSLEKESKLLKGCLSVEAMLDFAKGVLSSEGESVVERHVSECKSCKEEIELVKLIEPLPEVFPPEATEAGGMLFNTLRCFKLVTVALEKERVEKAKEAVKEPLLEKIRRLLFPPELVPVSISFAERKEPSIEFYRELNDEELAIACTRGQENGWRALIDKFTGLAFHICEKWGLKEHRENVWQDSLAVLLRKIRNFKKGKLSSFIATIVYYKCREKRRELKKGGNILSLNSHIKEGEVSFKEVLGPEQVSDKFKHLFYQEVEEQLISKETLGMIENAIEPLPGDFRQVIKSRFLEGMSVNEVSKNLEIPVKTVLTRILRGRVKLLEIMKKNYPELCTEIKERDWVKKRFKKAGIYEETRMEQMIKPGSKVFIVVREFDAEKYREGALVDLIQLEGNVATIEQLVKAAHIQINSLTEKYPIHKFSIREYYANDISEFARYGSQLRSYRPLVINASSLLG